MLQGFNCGMLNDKVKNVPLTELAWEAGRAWNPCTRQPPPAPQPPLATSAPSPDSSSQAASSSSKTAHPAESCPPRWPVFQSNCAHRGWEQQHTPNSCPARKQRLSRRHFPFTWTSLLCTPATTSWFPNIWCLPAFRPNVTRFLLESLILFF